MQKSTLYVLFFASAMLLFSGNVFTSSGGVTGPVSGSPKSNNQTCSQCHSGGSNTAQTLDISTDIPPSGYEANTNYTIKVKALGNGGTAVKGGFNATIESPGAFAGTLATKAGGGAQIGGNAATHTSNRNTFTGDSLVWQFMWNSGSSSLATIYVAANFANGNGNTSGDAVKTATLPLSKSILGFTELSTGEFNIYPNPAHNYITVAYYLPKTTFMRIQLFDLQGRVAATLVDEYVMGGKAEQTAILPQLAPGPYFMHITTDGAAHTEPIIIY